MALANSLRIIHSELATNPDNVTFHRHGHYMTMMPISVAHMARRAFNSKRKLFLSATLHPEMFIREMGFDERDCKFIEVKKSPFSPSNRQVQFMNVARLGNKAPDDSYRSVYIAASTILRRHRNDKGLILATSKKQCNDIMRFIDEADVGRILTVHGSADGLPADIIKLHKGDQQADSPAFTVAMAWYRPKGTTCHGSRSYSRRHTCQCRTKGQASRQRGTGCGTCTCPLYGSFKALVDQSGRRTTWP